MLRIPVDILHIAGFHDPAPVHHDNLIRDIRHHTEIVGDHQNSHLQFLLQIPD